MKNFSKISTSALLLAALVLVPAVSSANNGKGNDKNKDRKEEKNWNVNEKSSCFRAWGHLFAYGWMKKHVNVEVNADCYFPFGIAKKFGNATTTQGTDTTAPVITEVAANPRIGEAVITWKTDENSDGAVFFSTVNPVNTGSSTPTVARNDRTKNHKIVIGNLSAGTTYYAVVRSKDRSGNTTTSAQFSFTTKMPETAGDNTAPVVKNIAGVVSTSTIQIGWKTNEFTTGRVYYSLTSPASTSSSFIEDASLKTTHLVKVPNLSLGTKYYFLIVAKDAAGNSTKSSEFSFTTQGTSTPVVDTTAPVLSAISTSVSSSTISVTWTTNETATSKVYYNTGSSVDANSTTTAFVSDNTLTLSHTLSIPNLATSTLHSLIIESKDSSGNRTVSPQISATTLAL